MQGGSLGKAHSRGGGHRDKVSETDCVTKINEFYEKYQSDKLLVYCKCKKKKKGEKKSLNVPPTMEPGSVVAPGEGVGTAGRVGEPAGLWVSLRTQVGIKCLQSFAVHLQFGFFTP